MYSGYNRVHSDETARVAISAQCVIEVRQSEENNIGVCPMPPVGQTL